MISATLIARASLTAVMLDDCWHERDRSRGGVRRRLTTVGHCGGVNVEETETDAYDLSAVSGNDGLFAGGGVSVIK